MSGPAVAERDLPVTAATPVVDADGHVVEPRTAWAGLPAEHRPRIERDGHGYEHVVVGDTEILAVPLGTLATPGAASATRPHSAPWRNPSPAGRTRWPGWPTWTSRGSTRRCSSPRWGCTSPPSPTAAAAALARAYNDWLAGYCAADPGRLFGAAMLPLQDPDAAVAELHRAVGELGFHAAFVRPNPCCGRSLSDRAYDPVWSAAEELGVPIGVHEGSSVIVPTLGSDRPFNPLILHAVSHSFEEMLAYAQLAAFGVFERHPGLQVVFLESSGGWLPFWLERLDEQAESFGGFCPDMARRPSEYFARQCWISFEVDERTLPALAPIVGPERIVWGSDYPHHDATFPGAVEALRRTIAPCPPDAQAKVLGLNAAAVYRLPPRRTGPAGVVDAYFTAITNRDAGTLATCSPPTPCSTSRAPCTAATRPSPASTREGAFAFDDLLPRPARPEVDGDRVRVEPSTCASPAPTRSVEDVFTLGRGADRRGWRSAAWPTG